MAQAAKKKKSRQSGTIRLFRRLAMPYPLFVFILLSVGVLLAGWTAEVTGMNLSIKATVPAPALTLPAVIENPLNGDKLTQNPANVSGICPAGSYVEIFRNDIFSGTTLCSDQGSFQIAVELLPGSNKLLAKDFNKTDQQGPTSQSVTVSYEPPTAASPGATGSGSSPANTSEPSSPTAPKETYILNTDGKFQYSGYFTGQTVQLRLVAGGGTPPYTYDVDWGDHDPVYTIYKDGPFTLTHTYSLPGEFHGSHTIKIAGTDALGFKTFLQLFVIVNAKMGAAGTSSPTKPIILDNSRSAKWLWLAWPAYGIVILMSISYVLGEREELFKLSHRPRRA